MSMGCRQGTQPEMWVAYNEIKSGQGHRFYKKLNELLREARFDRRAEALCAPYYESSNTPGRKSVAPGVYFRMHLIGYFEGYYCWGGPCGQVTARVRYFEGQHNTHDG